MAGALHPVIGWAFLYALVFWGVSSLYTLFAERWKTWGMDDLTQGVKLVVPLILAFAIGVHLRSWGWIAGPPLAITLTMLPYPIYGYLSASASKRREIGAAFLLVSAGVVAYALVASLAAAAGVLFSLWRLSR